MLFRLWGSFEGGRFHAEHAERRRKEVDSGKLPLMDYQDIITVEADKRGGQPCIRGLRITVYDVLSYLASGMTEDEIISDYPDLTH